MINPTISVLISCMHQPDASIIYRTNIQSDVIVVNQCDRDSIEEFDFINKVGKNCHAKFICTTERGLSKSRNMAIRNTNADICLICDDDEILCDDYANKILQAFNQNPKCSLLTFKIENAGKSYTDKSFPIGYIKALKVASWQIAFNRNWILNHDIIFDISLGSGVSKAGGEENKFVYDCLKSGAKARFVPVVIGKMFESESQWFHGFTAEYFYDRGIMTKKLMSSFWAYLYGIYFLSVKYPIYHKNVSFWNASKNLLKGLSTK